MRSMTADAIDPRVARTRRDVVEATAGVLLAEGWDGVTHAEVARRSGYSKATIYAHWPARLDLIRDAVEHVCDRAHHPAATGNLREDLRTALLDFAADLRDSHLDRLLAGLVERVHTSDVVDTLRTRLYETGTSGMRGILETHLDPADVEPSLALLTGAVFVRVTFEGAAADRTYVDDLIDRVLRARRSG